MLTYLTVRWAVRVVKRHVRAELDAMAADLEEACRLWNAAIDGAIGDVDVVA